MNKLLKLDPPIPPLRNGGHLTVAEFERRYRAMPHVKKAELIEGIVYMPSPVSAEHHGSPHADLVIWLGLYAIRTPGTQKADNSTVKLSVGESQPQPDVFLRLRSAAGGQSATDEGGYVVGAPELAAEVAASSASYDLHEKLTAYRRNGVREYLVWRIEDRAFDCLVLRRGQYRPLAPADGLLKSKTFPGLWLDAAALVRGDMNRVVEVVQRGTASAEHRAFVAKLQAKLK